MVAYKEDEAQGKYVSFDILKFRRFRRTYNACVRAGRQSFIFEGDVWLTDYAKYAIEYMAPTFTKQK